MKKNANKLTALCLVGGLLIVGSTGAFAYASGNPYETYKAAVMETVKQTNHTIQGSVQMKQNGTEILSGNLILQQDGENEYNLISMNASGEKMAIEISDQDGTTIIHNGDIYMMDRETDSEDSELDGIENLSPNTEKLMNMLVDTLAGDVKNQFSSSGDMISVHLSGAQVPELANVAFAAMTEMQSKFSNHSSEMMDQLGFGNEFKSIVGSISSIRSDARIQSIDIDATVIGNIISTQDMTVVLFGKDAGGQNVEIEMNLTLSMKDIGTTAPQIINTSGKTVTEFPKNLKDWD